MLSDVIPRSGRFVHFYKKYPGEVSELGRNMVFQIIHWVAFWSFV
jgi:hypothetical protein